MNDCSFSVPNAICFACPVLKGIKGAILGNREFHSIRIIEMFALSRGLIGLFAFPAIVTRCSGVVCLSVWRSRSLVGLGRARDVAVYGFTRNWIVYFETRGELRAFI